MVASIATCPLDVIKTRLQAQRYSQGQKGYEGVVGQFSRVPCSFLCLHPLFAYNFFSQSIKRTRLHGTRHLTDSSTIDTIRSVWRYSGFKGFYRGLGPTMLGYLPTWAIYFAVYDGIKTTFGELPLGVQAPPPPAVSKLGTPVVKVDDRGKERAIYPAAQPKGYQPVEREHPWGLHIMSAMIAGATSTTFTNPLWVIKTRFMVRSILRLRWSLLIDDDTHPPSRLKLGTSRGTGIHSTPGGQYIGQKVSEPFTVGYSQVSWGSHMWLSSFRFTNS